MPWTPEITLDPHATDPLFLQLVRSITADIQRGRLAAGQRLPGTRSLAAALSVHRSTVISAFSELESEGWLTTRPGSGTFVADDMPEVRPARTAPLVASAGFSITPIPRPHIDPPLPPGVLSMRGGSPDLRHLPGTELARAWRRALRRTALLDYGDPRGHPRLRRAIAGMLAARRGLSVGPDQILITRGSQMALSLTAAGLLRPADRVGVEALGYPPAWSALRAQGAELVSVPVDRDGMQVASLAPPLRAIYLTPHHQFPTMVTLSPARRLRLLDFAARHRVAVIEDDYDHEYHYAGRPVLPLASADSAGVVVYIGTLSKVLAPGLRLGFVVAARPIIEHLLSHRIALDRQGDLAMECAVADLIEDGTFQRHLRRARRLYRARRDHLAGLLAAHFPDTLQPQPSAGGLALWVRAPGIDVDAWQARGYREGVALRSGTTYRLDGEPSDHLRLGFGRLNEAELTEGVARMKRAMPDRTNRQNGH